MKIENFRYDLLPLKDKLFRLALRITLHRQEAEDIVQDTLLKVWAKRHELAHVESLEAYCLTVCRNLALDRIALKDNQAERLEAHENGVCHTPDLAPTADERMENDERMQWVARLFSQLPEKQRSVMQLRDIEGLTVAQTAAVMHISEADVKTTLCRARQTIREQFKKIENYGL